MSGDAKLDKLIDMMETMMISLDRSFTELKGEIGELRGEVGELKEGLREVKERVIGIEQKIDLALEMVTRTSNHELERRVTELERKLA